MCALSIGSNSDHYEIHLTKVTREIEIFNVIHYTSNIMIESSIDVGTVYMTIGNAMYRKDAIVSIKFLENQQMIVFYLLGNHAIHIEGNKVDYNLLVNKLISAN